MEHFSTILMELIQTLDEFQKIETDKLNAASAREHQKIDGFLKEEQALLLKLRGLEQHRMQAQAALGWKDLTFREILNLATDEQKEQLEPLFEQMETKMQDLKETKSSSDRIIRVRLREFETILSNGDAQVPSHFQNTYG